MQHTWRTPWKRSAPSRDIKGSFWSIKNTMIIIFRWIHTNDSILRNIILNFCLSILPLIQHNIQMTSLRGLPLFSSITLSSSLYTVLKVYERTCCCMDGKINGTFFQFSNLFPCSDPKSIFSFFPVTKSLCEGSVCEAQHLELLKISPLDLQQGYKGRCSPFQCSESNRAQTELKMPRWWHACLLGFTSQSRH